LETKERVEIFPEKKRRCKKAEREFQKKRGHLQKSTRKEGSRNGEKGQIQDLRGKGCPARKRHKIQNSRGNGGDLYGRERNGPMKKSPVEESPTPLKKKDRWETMSWQKLRTQKRKSKGRSHTVLTERREPKKCRSQSHRIKRLGDLGGVRAQAAREEGGGREKVRKNKRIRGGIFKKKRFNQSDFGLLEREK